MKTHLISDLTRFGVWNDNYEDFFNNRAKTISEELQKRIVKQDVDLKPQPPPEEESNNFEETELE